MEDYQEIKNIIQNLSLKSIEITDLKTVINLKKQEKIKDFKGKLLWEGNLEEMRLDN